MRTRPAVLLAALAGVAVAAPPASAAEPTHVITYDTCRGYFVNPIIIRRVKDQPCKTYRVTYSTVVRQIGVASAAGMRPQATAQATAVKGPLALFARATTKRFGQRRAVTWKLTCDSGEEDVRDTTGFFVTRRAIRRELLPLAVPHPYTCDVSATARLRERGRLRLQLFARVIGGEIAREEIAQ